MSLDLFLEKFISTLFQGEVTPSVMKQLLSVISNKIVQTTKTTSYTLGLADAYSLIDVNSASGINITVPPNSSVPFDIGTLINICQYGAGKITFVPGAGVTIRTPYTLITQAQYATVSLRKRGTNEWLLSGDIYSNVFG